MKYLIILFLPFLTLSQNKIENDTIFLEEVVVNHQITKQKLKKISNNGKQNLSFSSVISNTIYLNQIKINNCIKVQKIVFHIKKKNQNSVKESFELLFFSVGKDGNPDKKIINETLIFQLTNSKKIEIDISKIPLMLCENFFVGFQKIMKENQNTSNFTILGNSNKKSATFIKVKNENWQKIEATNLMMDIYYF